MFLAPLKHALQLLYAYNFVFVIKQIWLSLKGSQIKKVDLQFKAIDVNKEGQQASLPGARLPLQSPTTGLLNQRVCGSP